MQQQSVLLVWPIVSQLGLLFWAMQSKLAAFWMPLTLQVLVQSNLDVSTK